MPSGSNSAPAKNSVRYWFVVDCSSNRSCTAILTFQDNLQCCFPGWEKLWLDELLVASGQITRGQLNDVLESQKLSEKKTEELLVKAGYLKPEQVSHVLRIQQMLLTAALIEVLSLSNLICAVQEAHAGSPIITRISL